MMTLFFIVFIIVFGIYVSLDFVEEKKEVKRSKKAKEKLIEDLKWNMAKMPNHLSYKIWEEKSKELEKED